MALRPGDELPELICNEAGKISVTDYKEIEKDQFPWEELGLPVPDDLEGKVLIQDRGHTRRGRPMLGDVEPVTEGDNIPAIIEEHYAKDMEICNIEYEEPDPETPDYGQKRTVLRYHLRRGAKKKILVWDAGYLKKGPFGRAICEYAGSFLGYEWDTYQDDWRIILREIVIIDKLKHKYEIHFAKGGIWTNTNIWGRVWITQEPNLYTSAENCTADTRFWPSPSTFFDAWYYGITDNQGGPGPNDTWEPWGSVVNLNDPNIGFNDSKLSGVPINVRWTGNIHDYDAVIWNRPVNPNFAEIGALSHACLIDLSDDDAGCVDAPWPIWMDQIVNEGYSGKVIIVASTPSWSNRVGSYGVSGNRYINNTILPALGCSMRLEEDTMAYDDNISAVSSSLPISESIGEHVLMTNVQMLPHFDSASITGGVSLMTPQQPYRHVDDLCDLTQQKSQYRTPLALEEITINDKVMWVILAGCQLFNPKTAITSESGRRINTPTNGPVFQNMKRLFYNLFDIPTQEPPKYIALSIPVDGGPVTAVMEGDLDVKP